jgi:hypothetical protein
MKRVVATFLSLLPNLLLFLPLGKIASAPIPCGLANCGFRPHYLYFSIRFSCSLSLSLCVFVYVRVSTDEPTDVEGNRFMERDRQAEGIGKRPRTSCSGWSISSLAYHFVSGQAHSDPSPLR